MKITLKQIQVFIAIAKSENMTQAAEKLYLSQSACSMALSAMENQLGNPLFDRLGKKLILNDQGRMLLPKAMHVLAEINDIENVMINTKKGVLQGHILIGASTTIGNYLLPQFIGQFINLYPLVQISLQIANTQQIIKKILNFDIDIGIIEGPCFSENVNISLWKKDELIVVASPNYQFNTMARFTKNNIIKEKWILRERGSGTREIFENAMQCEIQPFLELEQTEAIKQAVLAGLGISCLSRMAVDHLLRQGELVELKAPFLKISRDLSIILHKNKQSTISLSELIKALNADSLL